MAKTKPKARSKQQATRGRPTNYERCIKLIVEANEHMANDREDLADPLMIEIGQIRSKLDEFESEVIGRLVRSFMDFGHEIEIDEASNVGYDQ